MTIQFNDSLSRRQFSFLLGGLVVSSSVLANSSKVDGLPLWISAASDSKDQHWVTGFSITDNQAKVEFKQALPGRAHQVALNEEQGIFLVVARRPGRYLVMGDLHTGEILNTFTVPEDRHLLGHGVFSADGQYFYTVESNFQDLKGDSGRLGVWVVTEQSLERVQELETKGVGPHELLLMPDLKTLVIANGGIRTHPDTGRKKLNLETMQPSLAYLDGETGELLEQHYLPAEYHQASIRHLDVNEQGKVVLAMQYEGEAFNDVPLLMSHQRGQVLQALAISLPEQQQMKQYVGSVKFDVSGRFVAASCPKGNRITFWDTQTNEYKDSLRSRDGCGIHATQNGFVFTAGTGRISHYDILKNELNRVENPLQESREKVFWDNHLSLSSALGS